MERVLTFTLSHVILIVEKLSDNTKELYMRNLKTFLAALSISATVMLAGVNDDASARGLVRYCSQAHANQINAQSDTQRIKNRVQITSDGMNCGWIVYEDYSVRLR